MTTTDHHRRRLGELVRKRRTRLGLSVTRAAKSAGVSRGTWNGIEKAERETEQYNYAGIERVLEWELGSIEDVLAGGDPTPVEPQPRPEDIEPGDIEGAIRAIEQVRDAPDWFKQSVIDGLRGIQREREKAS